MTYFLYEKYKTLLQFAFNLWCFFVDLRIWKKYNWLDPSYYLSSLALIWDELFRIAEDISIKQFSGKRHHGILYIAQRYCKAYNDCMSSYDKNKPLKHIIYQRRRAFSLVVFYLLQIYSLLIIRCKSTPRSLFFTNPFSTCCWLLVANSLIVCYPL